MNNYDAAPTFDNPDDDAEEEHPYLKPAPAAETSSLSSYIEAQRAQKAAEVADDDAKKRRSLFEVVEGGKDSEDEDEEEDSDAAARKQAISRRLTGLPIVAEVPPDKSETPAILPPAEVVDNSAEVPSDEPEVTPVEFEQPVLVELTPQSTEEIPAQDTEPVPETANVINGHETEVPKQESTSSTSESETPPPPPAPPAGPGGTGTNGSGSGSGGRGPSGPAFAGGGSGNFQPPSPDQSTANTAPTATTIIERRGGNVAGPLVAFLFANYLSKRRDKKIMRQVKKQEKQLNETQSKLQNEQQRTTRLEQRTAAEAQDSSRRLAKVEQRPLSDVESNSESNDAATAVPIAEVLAASAFLAGQEIIKPNSPETSSSREGRENKITAEKALNKEEQPDNYRQDIREKNQPEELADKLRKERLIAEDANAEKIVREDVYERRYEVRDDPSVPIAPGMPSGTAASSTKGAQYDAAKVSATPVSPPRPPQQNSQYQPATATSDKDIYKNSVRNGVIFGISIIILGTLTYFLTR